jgi:prepilin-type N-terminal cleavage/methylation domain-containing protein
MHTNSLAVPRPPSGFTLVEMLIVLTIIGIGFATAVPRMQGVLHESALQGALNRLATDIAITRVRAVRASTRAVLVVNATGTGYSVIVDPTGTPTTYKTVTFASDYNGLTISPVNTSLVFDSRGMLVGGTGTLRATRMGRSDSLSVTGVGRVYRGY